MYGSRPLLAHGAIALLMTSASAFAMPANLAQPQMKPAIRAAIVLAQAECPEGQDCAPADAQAEPQAEAPRRKRKDRPEPQAEQPAEAQPEPQAEQPPQAQPEQPRRKREARPEAQPESQAEQPAEAQPEPQAEQPAQAQPEQPRRKREARPEAQPEPQAEQPAEAQPEPQAEQPAQAQPEQPRRKREARPEAQPEPQAEQPAEAQPEPQAEQQAQPEQPRRKREARPEAQPEPQAEQPAQAQPEQPAGEAAPTQSGEAAPDDGAKAPVLDSQKPAQRQRPTGGRPAKGAQPGEQPAPDQAAQPPAPPPGPPPADDRAAQEDAQPKEIVPVTQEKGERRRERPTVEQRERPQGAEVVRKLGDRIILQFDNQTIVESDDRQRMGRGARDVYYEDLPRGRTREVVVRENGVQVVTIRDRNGDIIRRSRIMPDGREYVLNYVEEENFDRVREWRDPGYDLPPMRLDIPEDEYIFDAGRAESADDYYDFLSEPPVERVERLYSVDEVKRSARIRDKTRRIDLDTITFEFGKADVPEDQVRKLEGVAQAMERLLEKNPAESFLVEGHTDAVGTDVANLALSDRRAEAVADALTNVFGIPPENLATQGYGEQYLKVRTQEPERENRRVAIRRITPLVAPVASAN